MIKELMHDPIFLAGKSEEATKEDIGVANDLLETLMAHRESCVGMAANMIGVRKRIIAFLDESGRIPTYTVMLNPVILKKDKPYDTEEGCLSLLGGPRKCKRYKTIKSSTKPWICRLVPRITRVGRRRLFSTKSTIATVC